MSFPFSITFQYKLNEVLLPDNVLAELGNLIEIFDSKVHIITNNVLYIRSRDSLVGFSYKVEIKYQKSENKQITVKIELPQLLKIVVLIFLFTAFFSTFSVSGFLWFSAILSVLFYFVNLLYIKITWSRIMKRFLENLKKPVSQENNLNTENKCPACNESLNLYDIFCPECGISLKQNNLSKNTDITKYMNTTIKYTYPKKKKKFNFK